MKICEENINDPAFVVSIRLRNNIDIVQLSSDKIDQSSDFEK